MKTVATDELNKIKHLLPEIDILGIDEGQFFPDLLPFAEFAANEGKVVIVSALDGDFLRKPFGSVCDLIPLCEHVVKLKAVCMVCQRDAAYSRRITNEEQTEVIGGSDKYIAVCRRCYNTENVELTPQKKRRTNATTPGGSVISGHVPQASPKAIRFLDSI
ncbi:Thymidine kinase [compost metagenome]